MTRFLILFIPIVLAFSNAGRAAVPDKCANAGGNYVNDTDPAHPAVKIEQTGCQHITVTDNAGVAYQLEMDGRSNTLSRGPGEGDGIPLLTNTRYTAEWTNINTIHLKARATLAFTPPNTPVRISVQLEYDGEALI